MGFRVCFRVACLPLALLACNSSVVSISLDAPIRSSADVTALPYSLRGTLGLPSDTPAGNGVGVAIVDSGISPASDLAPRLLRLERLDGAADLRDDLVGNRDRELVVHDLEAFRRRPHHP
jgi:hypothetical protein